MSELGGPEIAMPGEGGSGAPEQLSEQAKQRFQAAQAAVQQIRAEEKRAKKHDDQVARTIIQFLGGDDSSPLFLLISQLVARNCPSPFILAILSLVSESATQEVQAFIKEHDLTPSDMSSLSLPAHGGMSDDMQHTLLQWIARMRDVMAVDAKNILLKLLVDERNIDGTVLQLTTFVISDYFRKNGIKLGFDEVRMIAIGMLQTVFEPFLHTVTKKTLKARNEEPQAGNV